MSAADSCRKASEVARSMRDLVNDSAVDNKGRTWAKCPKCGSTTYRCRTDTAEPVWYCARCGVEK